MKYGRIDGVALPISRIIFGCALMPMFKGEDASAVLDAAVESGINAFDTAHEYALSEVSLGNWLVKRDCRTKLVLETKGCHTDEKGSRMNRACLKEDLETSLERLHTEYIDIYLLHRDDPEVEVGEIVEMLNDYWRAGKIKVFGGSNWSPERLNEANTYAKAHNLKPFTVSSPYFGLADQIDDPWGGCTTISGPSMKVARQWYRKNNMPILAYSSLARGLFTGKVKSDNPEAAKTLLDPFAQKGYCYPENFERLRRTELLAAEKSCTVAQLAIAWMFTQNLDVYSILSSSNPERLRSNLKALDIGISQSEASWMNLEE